MERCGPYVLIEPLGRGGVAEVFRAVRPGGPQVALKRVLAELEPELEFVSAFRSQASAATALQHPHLVRILDVGEDPPREGSPAPRHYLAMELVPGAPLNAVLNRVLAATRQIPRALCFTVLRAVLEALKHAHSGPPVRLPMVHGDVSPCNVLVGQNGIIKLADCGLMRARIRLTLPQNAGLKQKFGYMAPEQARGQPVDHRADLYGVGVMLYEMLTQRRMRRGATEAELRAQVVAGTWPGLETSGTTVEPELAALLARALQDNPAARSASAEELLRELLAYAEPRGLLLTEAQVAELVAIHFPEVAPNEERARALAQQQTGGLPPDAAGMPVLPADLPAAPPMTAEAAATEDGAALPPWRQNRSLGEASTAEALAAGATGLQLAPVLPAAAPPPWRQLENQPSPLAATRKKRELPVDPQDLMRWATIALAVAVVLGGGTVGVMWWRKPPPEKVQQARNGPDFSRLVGGRTVLYWNERLQRLDDAIAESAKNPGDEARGVELKARRDDLLRKAHALGLTELSSEALARRKSAAKP